MIKAPFYGALNFQTVYYPIIVYCPSNPIILCYPLVCRIILSKSDFFWFGFIFLAEFHNSFTLFKAFFVFFSVSFLHLTLFKS